MDAPARSKRIHSFDGVYSGETTDDDRPQGEGTKEFKNGASYTGQWQDGKRHGEGTFVWTKGHYTGQWWFGMRHGDGLETLSNGETYAGKFEEDKKHGFGTYTWEDGTRYEGNWVKGKMEGQGKMIGSDGSVVHSGKWKQDEPVDDDDDDDEDDAASEAP